MGHQIDCPSCGASVNVKRGQYSAVCGYCGNSVIVPGEYREASHGSTGQTVQNPGAGCGRGVAIVAGLAGLLVVGGGALVFYLAASSNSDPFKDPLVTAVFQEGVSPVLEFGGPGTGRGYFDGPECITFDGEGNIYVGERESGRVQVFDETGNFVRQWSFARPGEQYLSSMSASYDGTLFLVYDSEVFVHHGGTGELLGMLHHPDGWGFGDVDVSHGDQIAASWYCNRDDLVLYGPSGDMITHVREAVSGVTGDSELSMVVAAGNTGETYLFGSFNSVVVVYDAAGRFTDRFGNDQVFTMVTDMDVDPEGRIWVSDFGDLKVFSGAGELIRTVDPGVSVYGFTIDDEMRLWAITANDTVMMFSIRDMMGE